MADPDRALALHYAGKAQAALAALWALDEALGRIVATTTEPLIGQMRLTWWHERLEAIDGGARVAEPLLTSLGEVSRTHGIGGAALAALVEGWDVLIERESLSDGDLMAYARDRGERLFALSTEITGGTQAAASGRAWALADFARHCSDRQLAERALALASIETIPRNLAKPLRVLAWLTRYDVSHGVAAPRPKWTMLRAALA